MEVRPDVTSMRPGSSFGLFIARFCTSAWIGAASLFVIVGVTEVTQTGFDSTVKDTLVAVRFPAFYWCGGILIGLGWFGTWMACDRSQCSSFRRVGSLILLSLALGVMLIDYVWIYHPLLDMVTPPGQTKPATFLSYHQASKWINFLGLVFCLAATTLLNWPTNRSRDK